MKMVVFVLALMVHLTTLQAEVKVEEVKSKVLSGIDQRINGLQEFKSCVQKAKKEDEIKSCRRHHHMKMKSLKQERHSKWKERKKDKHKGKKNK